MDCMIKTQILKGADNSLRHIKKVAKSLNKKELIFFHDLSSYSKYIERGYRPQDHRLLVFAQHKTNVILWAN